MTEVVNRIGILTLNRPKQLNALSHGMVIALTAQLRAWSGADEVLAVVLRGAGDRGFCAGGDVRAVRQSVREGTALHRDFFVDEYRLDYLIHRFPKPTVVLMDGITMGGGMGLGQGAALRLVTERSRLAMPETGIGFIPDVGASYFLAKMQVELALYLGLTGVAIGAADARLTGLADAVVPSGSLGALQKKLRGIRFDAEHDGVLAALRKALTNDEKIDSLEAHAAPLLAVLPALFRHFRSAKSVAQVMASLAAETDPRYAEWAQSTLKIMQAKSPLMMCVTHELLLRGRRLDLADCFRMEYDAGQHSFRDGDFDEGVRAVLVDKDHAPRWRPSSIEEVPAARVQAFFGAPKSGTAHPLSKLHFS